MSQICFTIYGQLFSKSNSRQLVKTKTGKTRNIKSANALRCAKFYIQQMVKFWDGKPPLTNTITLGGTIFYPSARQDLDESLLMDCLEKAGIIKNDRQIIGKSLEKGIDKRNPRCEIVLTPVNWQEARGE